MEKDIILLATTITHVGNFATDAQRVNVALTRARHHLLVLGCSQVLRSSSPAFAMLLSGCHMLPPGGMLPPGYPVHADHAMPAGHAVPASHAMPAEHAGSGVTAGHADHAMPAERAGCDVPAGHAVPAGYADQAVPAGHAMAAKRADCDVSPDHAMAAERAGLAVSAGCAEHAVPVEPGWLAGPDALPKCQEKHSSLLMYKAERNEIQTHTNADCLTGNPLSVSTNLPPNISHQAMQTSSPHTASQQDFLIDI